MPNYSSLIAVVCFLSLITCKCKLSDLNCFDLVGLYSDVSEILFYLVKLIMTFKEHIPSLTMEICDFVNDMNTRNIHMFNMKILFI